MRVVITSLGIRATNNLITLSMFLFQGVYASGARLVGGCWSGEEVVPEDGEGDGRPLTLMLTVSHALPPTPVVRSVSYSCDSFLERALVRFLSNVGTHVLYFPYRNSIFFMAFRFAGLGVGAHGEQIPVSGSPLPCVIASPSLLRVHPHAAPSLAPVRV